jgi:hypothetical protein
MTTQREKLRKLRALARSPNKHEAALALAKAEELEGKIRDTGAKGIARAIAQLLETRGLVVRVRRRQWQERQSRSKVDADVRYGYSQARYPWHRIEILITEYPALKERSV